MKNLGSFPSSNWWLYWLLSLLFACKNEQNPRATLTETIDVTALDPHSYANFNEIQTKHLSLELDVSFANKTIYGIARHEVVNKNAKKAVFDINGPLIQKVTIGPKHQEVEVDFVIGKMDEDSVLGQPLIVSIQPSTKFINIYYKTGVRCDAVEWVNPESEKDAFLYTQGQAILTRSWIPLQDAPSNRITYDACVKVEPGLMALMSAENPTSIDSSGIYRFQMKYPIPSYLIALTVGDIQYHPYNERCGVYAPKNMILKAKNEFSELPKMMHAIEKHFGPYAWGKYDIMVQHPSFPFGGMENPCLTFLNPSIIAGDKSLVSVVAHELAHSWSGNLVTNETWNDFWLNEGVTVYLEHRIMEELFGSDYSEMLSEIEWSELQKEMIQIEQSQHPEDGALLLQLKNRNPDDGMTSVAYIKGAYFLKTLEHLVGRTKMDEFLTNYFKRYRFKSINTEKFVALLKETLLGSRYSNFNYQSWIYETGIPTNSYQKSSSLLEKMQSLADKTNRGIDIFAPQRKVRWIKKSLTSKKQKKVVFTKRLNIQDFTTQQWIMYFRSLNAAVSAEKLQKINEYGSFSSSNSEVRFEWFLLNLRNRNWKIEPELKQFIQSTGRRKYILPLFSAIVKDKSRLDWAREVYSNARHNYHSVTRNSVEKLLY